MKSKANWSTEAPTPGQLKEFFTQIEAGDITKKKLETFLGNGENFKSTASQIQAQKIMGQNFFGVEDAIKYFDVEPTKEQLKALSDVPYSEKVFKECKDTHILAAIFPISILEIRERVKRGLFFSYEDSWYNDESFAKEKGKVCWKLIRKTPVPDSTSKNWREQLKLLGEDEEVPTAQVMVYTIMGHYLKTGERLFKNFYVRTSSTDLVSSHVIVGDFTSCGFHICSLWDNSRDSRFGVASAWKS